MNRQVLSFFFKYSCTIRTLRKVATDATTTLNEGLFAGERKAYFRFTKQLLKWISLSQEVCVSRSPFSKPFLFLLIYSLYSHKHARAHAHFYVVFPKQRHNCYRIAISLTALTYNIKLLYLLAQNIAMTLYKWLLQKNLLVGDVLICILCKKNLSGWVYF